MHAGGATLISRRPFVGLIPLDAINACYADTKNSHRCAGRIVAVNRIGSSWAWQHRPWQCSTLSSFFRACGPDRRSLLHRDDNRCRVRNGPPSLARCVRALRSVNDGANPPSGDGSYEAYGSGWRLPSDGDKPHRNEDPPEWRRRSPKRPPRGSPAWGPDHNQNATPCAGPPPRGLPTWGDALIGRATIGSIHRLATVATGRLSPPSGDGGYGEGVPRQ